MQYLLMIYNSESGWDKLSEAEQQKMKNGFGQLRDDLTPAGKFVGGNQLQPVATATTVRFNSGKKAVTDGPFAETKEQLGGYFLVEAKDLDEALSIASRMPLIDGSVEIRPVVLRG